MRLGLGGRLSLAFAALVAISALLVAAASSVTTGREVSADLDQFLATRSEEIADGRRPQPAKSLGSGDRGPVVQPLAVEPDSQVQVLSRSGRVEVSPGAELPVTGADVELSARDGMPYFRTVNVDGEQLRMVTRHVRGGGAVQVARSLDPTTTLMGVLRSRIAAIALGMAAVAGAVGWLLAQRITQPLRSLTDAVDSVATTQDLTVNVPTGGDEVGRLGRGFDRMLGALDQSRDDQRRLVQDAAHELRTPLTSITANIQWLRRARDVDDSARCATLDAVSRELGELNSAVREIVELAVEGTDGAQWGAIELTEVVVGAVEQLRARSGREVTLDLQPSPVWGDAAALSRAIGNLLSNADKYSPPHLPIHVEVRGGGVWVGDSGAGIPSEYRRRVEDRFYRLPRDRGAPGSGLGLSIVARVAADHGGTLEVGESASGGALVGFRVRSSADSPACVDSPGRVSASAIAPSCNRVS